jgi:cation diffusion facilitator CzcD-associated flavoprotein CzcO
VPPSLYSFSFRPGHWSRPFPPQQEILACLRALSAELGLAAHFRFGSGVSAAEFDEHCAVWNLTLDDGDTLQAIAIVSAVGQLNRPALPDIAGRDDFSGPSWHSACWDHGVDLTGRQAAVVGTGARAIQFVPEAAKAADCYPTLARPDVELVTDPIERIGPDGVVTADGTLRLADVIIYGPGSRPSTSWLLWQ